MTITRKRKVGAVAALLLTSVATTSCSSSHKTTPSKSPSAAVTNSNSTDSSNSTVGNGGKQFNSIPAKLSIPSIKFDQPVKSLGLASDGTISPPAKTTQWYNKTVIPGANGISVIAAHVTYNGPDVFYNLHKVKVGDRLTVSYQNGKTQSFMVTREKAVDKNVLQHDPTVWGKANHPSLVLVTCDASSKLVGHHHVDNYVVWTIPTS